MLNRAGSLLTFVVAAAIAPSYVLGQNAAQRSLPVERRVMTFYYPWYGIPEGPGGAGRTIHWGKIDAANHDIAASTHYPTLGAYDSHDPQVIEQHCQWAKAAHIDTFIVSWWGHGDYTDRAMPRILEACARHGLAACIYYERVPKPQTAATAAQDIIRVLDKYGSHPAHLRVDGKPVVFIYGRAVGELGLTGWLEAVQLIKAGHRAGAVLIGDQFSYGAARVFDGVHTYNTAGSLAGRSSAEAQKWAAATYPAWVQLADAADKISTITVIPGYDDTKIRDPGLAVERHEGELYRVEWEQAIAADPHWVLITSFNEWHEGSEVEPSLEFGDKYLQATGEFAGRFQSTRRTAHAPAVPAAITPAQKEQLRAVLQKKRIAVLPGPESMAFWWLLEIGVTPKMLTWEGLVADGIRPQDYPILLYCAGETYQRTVRTTGDVDEALIRYQQAGGCLAALPSLPWPFYYDETHKAVNQSHRFGLTLKMGWEKPPAGVELRFAQPERRLPHLPERLEFPASGDLRWRGFYDQSHAVYVPLLQLRNRSGAYLGDGAAYAQPATGGHAAYVWFGLLRVPEAEALLYDLFTFLAARVGP
ncbi:MAG: glycoside hydrolase family 99-like domain-containing protein [Planctomycetes bacterium]|nr:glycoside hydrolase family 99-like domain-containing protein [Planctomycetota bacterium]